MKCTVTIKVNTSRHYEVALHPEKARTMGLANQKMLCVSFGNLKRYAQIRVSPETGREVLELSQKLIQELYLPQYPVYELRLNRNELRVGPFVGLLLSADNEKLTASRLKRLLVYVRQYSIILGAVVVFALDGVDRENRRIEGYCFNPGAKEWQRGIFPYPAAIYRTIGLGADWKNHFLSAIGDALFNNRYFNKWEMYQWFSGEPGISSHLPYTQLYDSPRAVLELLRRFSKVYCKPVLGLRGRGIVRISFRNPIFSFEYRDNKANHKVVFEDPQQAIEYIENRFGNGKYLIQQGVDLLEYQGRIIDFRCVVQKNQSNDWVCQSIIGRTGVKDSIVSNISNGGEACTAGEILGRALKASPKQIDELTARMRDLAITVCNKLSQFGINCGTLGLDIALDEQGFLWLIEINNRDPDPGIALDAQDSQLYITLKAGPLLYAKYLAGFGQQDEDFF